MREILFRGKPKRLKRFEWVHGDLMNYSETIAHIFPQEIAYPVGVIPETVCLFTGIYEDKKWEELTDAEKVCFYNRQYDGLDEECMPKKYANVEDVKHLWKGKPIFEGDIVEPVLVDGTHKGFSWGCQVVVFDRGAFCLKSRRGEITPMCSYAANVKFKVYGNIHDNPELMEVTE
jgi:hypothetical protein